MHLSFYFALIATTTLLSFQPISTSYAGLFSLFEHGLATAGKDAGRAAGRAAGHAGSTFAKRAEALAALSAVGAGAIYVEREGGQLLTRFVKGHAGPTIDLTDAQWKAKLVNAAKSSDGPQQLVVDLQTIKALERDFADVERSIAVQVADPSGGVYRLKHFGKIGAALEIKPGLLLPLKDAPLTAIFRQFLEGSVDRGQLHIATTMAREDADSLRRLGQIAGDKLKSLHEIKDANGQLLLPGGKGGLTVVIGHVEGNGFAIRRPDGTLADSISFEAIEKAAKEKDVSAVFVGCDTYTCSRASGTTRIVRDTEVADSLRKVLQADNNADLLAAFGSADSPFVITNSSISAAAESFTARLERLPAGAAAVRGGAITIRVAAFLSKASKADSTLWLLLLPYGFAASLAWTLEAFDGRSLTGAFDKVFPTLPNPLLSPRLYRALAVARMAIFYLLSPLVAAVFFALIILSAFNFTTSAWRTRDEVLEGLWTLLIIPHRVLLGLCILASNLLWIGIPVVVASSLLGILLYPIGMWGVVVEMLGLVVAAYFIFRNRRMIVDWLDERLIRISMAISGRRSTNRLMFTFYAVKALPLIAAAVFALIDVV
ncbi:hypothetical protein [Bradyrhizobium sp. CCGE-LA001]|uniref:hypothetical protein n=1 Tax=Bradyrhizobium sp. CCGE-LA001 TaxID=1223566 RepID=UPI0002AA7398|nr:hypothetical protein [Bradyrhizobium sp. CCGE-LA001]